MHMQHETVSSDIDEAGLVARAKAMDEAAWDYLLQSYYGRLQAYFWNRIGDRAAAEDLASQVFEEAVARIKDYECRGLPLSAWLFRIARNMSVDYVRRRARRVGATIVEPRQVPVSQLLEQQLETEQLWDAMRSLNEEQRHVVTLRFISGLSTADTGAALGKSTGAVKAIQHRALRTMRRTLCRIDPMSWGTDDANV